MRCAEEILVACESHWRLATIAELYDLTIDATTCEPLTIVMRNLERIPWKSVAALNADAAEYTL